MEWAAGLIVRDGRLRAIVISDNEVTFRSLDELWALSMRNPNLQQSAKFRVSFNLSELRLVSGEEFTKTLFEKPAPAPDNHSVFEGQISAEEVFAIPALTLLKALVAPHRHLLRYLLEPGFLFAVGTPSIQNGMPTWTLNSSTRQSYTDRFLRVFSVLSSTEAGNAFLADIHNEALAGRIGFPSDGLAVTADMFGHIVDNKLYCHKLVAKSLNFADRFSSGIEVGVNLRASRALRSRLVEPTFDYSRKLTDEEWRVISGIVNVRKTSLQSDVRTLVDIILFKYHTELGWRSCGTDEIPYIKVVQRLRVWRMNGVWYKVCSALAEMRSGPIG